MIEGHINHFECTAYLSDFKGFVQHCHCGYFSIKVSARMLVQIDLGSTFVLVTGGKSFKSVAYVSNKSIGI